MLEKGRLRINPGPGDSQYLQVTVFSSEPLDLDALTREFGGQVYAHSGMTKRWYVQRASEIHEVQKVLAMWGHPASSILGAYLEHPGGVERWLFVEWLREEWQCGTISLAQLSSS